MGALSELLFGLLVGLIFGLGTLFFGGQTGAEILQQRSLLRFAALS